MDVKLMMMMMMMIIMAMPKSLFERERGGERETRINIDSTSIPIASSLKR